MFTKLRVTESAAGGDKAHILRNLVLSEFLSSSARHCACAVADQDTVPSVGVGIRHGTKHALVGVDASEK